MIAWHNGEAQRLHPVERAARLHTDFVCIRPFVDGNGRTARLLLNLELIRAGFPAAVLPVERRLRYYEALDRACAQADHQPFLELIVECVEESFAVYWHALDVG